MEVWGSQGRAGAAGGYSVGYKRLSAGDILYIACGSYGNNWWDAGWNGGSTGGNSETSNSSSGGGGATHIALNSNRGVLSNYNSYRNEILIVAGGGGGGASWGSAGSGGGTTGGSASNHGGGTTGGGSQTSGYAFGQGQNGQACGGYAAYGSDGNGGGGGGWYGGYSSYGCGEHQTGGGSGGSGYIGGVTSWNGNNPSMSNGARWGYGKAKITIMSITVTLTCPSASNKTYNGSSQTGMSCPTGSTPSSGCSGTDAKGYTCTCTAKSGYTFNGNCSRN